MKKYVSFTIIATVVGIAVSLPALAAYTGGSDPKQPKETCWTCESRIDFNTGQLLSVSCVLGSGGNTCRISVDPGNHMTCTTSGGSCGSSNQ